MSGCGLGYEDVRAAGERIAGGVRPVVLAPGGERTWFALEFLQHTGSFKARGALNFLTARRAAGQLPKAGVAIASGGNAGLAAAWAAAREGVRATVFTPTTAPEVKVAQLRALGAEVRQVGTEYAEAVEACAAFVAERGALASHAYDQPLVAAGAGTLVDEIVAARPSVTTVVVAVGGGGLLAGVAAAAAEHGLDVVGVEPERCGALHAALAAGRVVDVPVTSVAADSLGARRVSADALWWAQQPHVRSVLVSDEEIVRVRRELWREHRLAVEHAAATALAGAPKPPTDAAASVAPAALAPPAAPAVPADGEVCVVLCGANTDLSDLAG